MDKAVMTLREWRRAYGASQQQLAQEVGVTQGCVSKIELATAPTLMQETFERIIKALGIEPWQLDLGDVKIGDKGKPPGSTSLKAHDSARVVSVHTCPRCYIVLPLTGQCDNCD